MTTPNNDAPSAPAITELDVLEEFVDADDKDMAREIVRLRLRVAEVEQERDAKEKLSNIIEGSESRRTEERDAAEFALARLASLAHEHHGIAIRVTDDRVLHVTTLGDGAMYVTTHVAPTLREIFDAERPTLAALRPPAPPHAHDAGASVGTTEEAEEKALTPQQLASIAKGMDDMAAGRVQVFHFVGDELREGPRPTEAPDANA